MLSRHLYAPISFVNSRIEQKPNWFVAVMEAALIVSFSSTGVWSVDTVLWVDAAGVEGWVSS